MLDLDARDAGATIAGDAARSQRGAIEDVHEGRAIAPVPPRRLDPDRVVRRDGIEVTAVGIAALGQRLRLLEMERRTAERAQQDPAAGIRARDLTPHDRLHIGHRATVTKPCVRPAMTFTIYVGM
jgi:hypothetical protein